MAKKQLTDSMKAVIATMVELLKAGSTDEEILQKCKTDKIGEEECTDELLLALLEAARKQVSEEATIEKKVKFKTSEEEFYGNKDVDKKHRTFPSLWKNSVVVRTSQSSKVGPRDTDIVEIPSSVKYLPFDPGLFDTHIKQGMFGKKNTEIIHDPR